MNKLIRVGFIFEKVEVKASGVQKHFAIAIPPGIKKIRGILVTSSLSNKAMETTNRYFGKGAAGETTSAFINTLSKERISSKYKSFEVNLGPGEHAYYLYSKRLGVIQANVNGIDGGFKTPLIISITDAQNGFTEDYYLLEGLDDNLGTVKISIS